MNTVNQNNLITRVRHLEALLADRYARMHHEFCIAVVSSGKDVTYEEMRKHADFYITTIKKREETPHDAA